MDRTGSRAAYYSDSGHGILGISVRLGMNFVWPEAFVYKAVFVRDRFIQSIFHQNRCYQMIDSVFRIPVPGDVRLCDCVII